LIHTLSRGPQPIMPAPRPDLQHPPALARTGFMTIQKRQSFVLFHCPPLSLHHIRPRMIGIPVSLCPQRSVYLRHALSQPFVPCLNEDECPKGSRLCARSGCVTQFHLMIVSLLLWDKGDSRYKTKTRSNNTLRQRGEQSPLSNQGLRRGTDQMNGGISPSISDQESQSFPV
jgi:hypothetical protein